jgi:ORF6N domain
MHLQIKLMEIAVIQHKIREIRGQKVILDFDLAALYEVETKVLKQAVKRNIVRFPPDFMFQITPDEWINLRSQFVTSSWGGHRHLPLAFTEHGVTMLASILKSDRAIKMNIAIVRAFIALRELVFFYKEMADQISAIHNRLGEHDVQLNSIYEAIENMLDEKVKQRSWDDRDRIGFNQ